jgi:release factor glutamine methyltransferase
MKNYRVLVLKLAIQDMQEISEFLLENYSQRTVRRFLDAFHDQKETLTNEAKKYFKDDRIEVYKDMSGKDRMLFIYHNC